MAHGSARNIVKHRILQDTYHEDVLSAILVSGDILIVNADGKLIRLAKGSDGQVLKLASGFPSWAAESSVSPVSQISTLASDFITSSTTYVNTGLEITLNAGKALDLLLLQARVTNDTAAAVTYLQFYDVTAGTSIGMYCVMQIINANEQFAMPLMHPGAYAGHVIRVQMKVGSGTGTLKMNGTQFSSVEFA